MATLTIRNVPEDVHKGLRLRAAENGRSVEEEIRRILAEQVVSDSDYRNPKTPEEVDAAVKRLQALFMPARQTYSVDRFIADKRIEAKRELRKLEEPRAKFRK
jgi:plasmid stability protein